MSTSDSLLGKQLGDYKIEALIGHGGMARVYRGLDEKLQRFAAVKVIEPTLIASGDEEEYRDRFLREARAIARLNHPNIVGVYQFAQEENLYFIAMAYLQGEDLRQILKTYVEKNQLMPRKQMFKVLYDIASGLDYAHKNDIIHRDIKPSNIIVTTEGNAILTDFGLALNAIEGTIGNTFGSVHYIAPEQAISSAQAVPQSDQYSLGIIVYEMLAGQVPFDDASAMSVALKHISDPPPPIRDLNPNVSRELEDIVMRSLDKEPHTRFQYVTEFITALENAVDNAPDALKWDSKGERPMQLPPLSPSLDDEAPTLPDTSSRPQSIGSALPRNKRSAQGGGSRTGLIIAFIVLALLIMAGLLFGINVMNNNNANATGTAVAIAQAEATETVNAIIALTEKAQSEATETSNAIIVLTGTAQSEATETSNAIIVLTETAQAQATETANAIATGDALTATANMNATSTSEFQMTGTAETELTNIALTTTADFQLTSTAEFQATSTAAFEGTQTAIVNMNATATAEELQAQAMATNTQGAIEAAVAMQIVQMTETKSFELTLESSTPTFTPTDTSTPTATPTSTATSTATSTPTATFTPSATFTPTSTPTPQLFALEEEPELLLRYDGRSILITNRSNDNTSQIVIADLVFTQYISNEEGTDMIEGIRFRMEDWAGSPDTLRDRGCLQIWDNDQFSRPSNINELADNSCPANPFWRTANDTFWFSRDPKAYFEVSYNGIDYLATCPSNRPRSTIEQRCVIDLR